MPAIPGRHRLAATDLTLANLSASPPLLTVLVGLISVFLGIALVAKPLAVFALVLLGLAAAGVALVYARPALSFGGLVVMLALIPTYAAPAIGPLLFIPAAAAGWGIAAALLWRNMIETGRLFQLNAIDYAVFSFVGLMAVSLSFSDRPELTDYIHNMFMWVGPYLGARLLLRDVERPARLVALTFAIVAVGLAPIALIEAAGGSNPFFNLNFNGGEFSIWATQASRFGEIRATTSFGHPIAYSMFLACSAMLSMAQGIHTEEQRPRLLWYGAAVVAVGTMALTLSRTGWVMMGVGLPLLALALIGVKGAAKSRLLGLFGVVLCALLAVAIVLPSALQGVPGFGHSEESHFNTSGLYREALLKRALEPGVLGLWGNPVDKVTPAVNFGTATDNAYIILADYWGLIPTFALFSVAAALLWATLRLRHTRGDPVVILPIVAFTCLVAIFFVAFITQQQAMIWLLIGCAGAVYERFGRRSAEEPRPDSERLPPEPFKPRGLPVGPEGR